MASNIFQIKELTMEERLKTKCTHLAEVDSDYLKTLAGATATLQLFPYQARDIIDFALLDLVTPFAGAGLTAFKANLGYNNATLTDRADAFLFNLELSASPVLADAGSADPAVLDSTYGAQELAVLDTLRARRPFAAQESGNLELVLAATGANLSALTAGRVRVFFNVIRLAGLRPINL